MALTQNERTLCNKLLSDFDGLLQPGRAAKALIRAEANRMLNQLTGMAGGGFSPANVLNQAISDYRDAVNTNLPSDSVDELQSFKNFLDNCPYLDFLEPVSAMLGTVIGIFKEIAKLLNGITLPEFGVGSAASLIDKLLSALPGMPGGDLISDLLDAASKLIDCLNAVCVAQDPGTYLVDADRMTTELNDTYADLNIVDLPGDPNYGKFNYSKLYNDAGLSVTESAAIDGVKGNINASKDAGVESVDKAAKAIQNLTKSGSLF